MAILGMDSFALYNVTNDLAGNGWELSNSNRIEVLPTGGSDGQAAIRFTLDDTLELDGMGYDHYGDIFHRLDTPITNGTTVAGLKFRIDSLPTAQALVSILQFEGANAASTHCEARFNNLGDLYLQTPNDEDTAGPIRLNVGEWYHLEMKVYVHDTSGTAELRLNGTTILTLSGDIEDYYSTIDGWRIGPTEYNSWLSPADAQFTVSDFYAFSNTGNAPTDFLGETTRVEYVKPNAEGSTIQFAPTIGTDNSAMVDDLPKHDYDGTRNRDQIIGNKDTFDFASLSEPTYGDIAAIKATMVAKKADATARTMNIIQRHNSVEADSAAVTIAETFEYHNALFDVNPDTGNPWTKAEFATAQFGYKNAT